MAEVLKSPLVIFQGLKREGKETAFCYVGKPQRHGEDWSGPGPNGMVFMVCVTVDGVVFEWRWEKENKVDGNRPKDIKQRFENEIWKH